MTNAMTIQLVENLKGYFKREEFSDKMLHIVESKDIWHNDINACIVSSDENILFAEQEKRDGQNNIGDVNSGGDGSDSGKNDNGDNYENLSSPPQKKKKKSLNAMAGEVKNIDVPVDPSGTCKNIKRLEPLSTATTPLEKNAASSSNLLSAPKLKIFSNKKFYIELPEEYPTTCLAEEISRLAGVIVENVDYADYIISAFISKNEIINPRERTVLWVWKAIKDSKIWVHPNQNITYFVPQYSFSKPLSSCIVCFNQYKGLEKDMLSILARNLGATVQEKVLVRQNHNVLLCSTHLILKHADGEQYRIAKEWDVATCSKDWLWNSLYTRTVANIDDYLVLVSNNSSNPLNILKQETEYVYSSFPVHSLVLCVNSPYFKILFSDSGMRETTEKDVVVKVDVNEGEYFELLLHSFYNQDIVKDMGPLETAKVMKIADRFLCDSFIENGVAVLSKKNVKNMEQCNKILDFALSLPSFHSIYKSGNINILKNMCTNFLLNKFFKLELRPKLQEEFVSMSFKSFLLLLECGQAFLSSENAVLHFVLIWLKFDETRQTEPNIESLLKECRHEHITTEFLKDMLSPTDTILSKWRGYLNWYINAVSYQSLTKQYKRVSYMPRRSRNISYDNELLESCTLNLICREGDTPLFTPFLIKNQCLIFDGYPITPMIKLRQSSTIPDQYIVRFYMIVGYSKKDIEKDNFYFDVDIAFAIFPSNFYPISFSPINKTLVWKYYRPIHAVFHNKNTFRATSGTADKGLYNSYFLNGISLTVAFKKTGAQWPNFVRNFQNRVDPLHRTIDDSYYSKNNNERLSAVLRRTESSCVTN